MKAMVMHDWNGPYKLEDRPIPEVGPHDVLVKVKACGFGLTLTNLRAGMQRYPCKFAGSPT